MREILKDFAVGLLVLAATALIAIPIVSMEDWMQAHFGPVPVPLRWVSGVLWIFNIGWMVRTLHRREAKR